MGKARRGKGTAEVRRRPRAETVEETLIFGRACHHAGD